MKYQNLVVQDLMDDFSSGTFWGRNARTTAEIETGDILVSSKGKKALVIFHDELTEFPSNRMEFKNDGFSTGLTPVNNFKVLPRTSSTVKQALQSQSEYLNIKLNKIRKGVQNMKNFTNGKVVKTILNNGQFGIVKGDNVELYATSNNSVQSVPASYIYAVDTRKTDDDKTVIATLQEVSLASLSKGDIIKRDGGDAYVLRASAHDGTIEYLLADSLEKRTEFIGADEKGERLTIMGYKAPVTEEVDAEAEKERLTKLFGTGFVSQVEKPVEEDTETAIALKIVRNLMKGDEPKA